MSMPLKVFVIAGEPSGDRLGASLIEGLKDEAEIELYGLGGPLMEAAGLRSQFDISDLAIMGLAEVLPKIPKLLRRIRQATRAILTVRPDVIVTIDSPDFCLRVLKRVRKVWTDALTVHYVAPSVWAWRPERAEKMAKHVDHVLALLPFEPPLMEKAGMTCDFVGHPIVDDKNPNAEEVATFKSSLASENVLAVLPGSRRGEVNRMLPLFGDVVDRLLTAYPDLAIVIPTVSGSEVDVKRQTAGWKAPVTFISQGEGPNWEHRKQTAIAACDAALVTSGTVSLEVASTGCPQVVAYKTNKATARMIKKMILIDTATLVNILTDTRDIPEFMLESAQADAITPVLSTLLAGQDVAAAQKATAKRAMDLLTPPEANAAARSVLRFVAKNRSA
ncbi:MAG: lipid-A-disaccharide synthase [Pseudomonadota bacterium]